MNKTKIKSAVSIEFALSIEKAGKMVDCIFKELAEGLIRNKSIKLQKFGKINLVSKKSPENVKLKSIAYIPSKKLARRVNNNFENLKKIKLALEERKELESNDKFDYKMSDEFLKQYRENKDEVLKIVLEDNDEPVKNSRIVIPDKLIKLHKEITEEESKEKDNLPG